MPEASVFVLLLGVQFDDVGFVDFVFVRKFISLRESGQSSCPVVEALFDVWKIEGLQFLEGLLEHFVSSVSFAEGDNLAGTYRIGRDINSLPSTLISPWVTI